MDLKFTLTTDETNLVLEGLGHLSFGKVYKLVSKIQRQAQQQLSGRSADSADAAALRFPTEETSEKDTENAA